MTRLFALALMLAATPALAVPTPVTVRVLSQGAKFIGSGMGGMAVTLSNARTGKPLAFGQISGGTGDTARIMNGAPRGTPVADAASAAFATAIDIAEPTEVRVEVKGPLKQGVTPVTASATRWLIPGQPVAGDGWVVELPGLALTARREAGQVVADVSMLCGCPINNESLWQASRFTLEAWVGGQRVVLPFAGQTGRFAGAVPAGAGWVTAIDSLTGATGAVKLAP